MTLLELLRQPAIEFMVKSGRQPEVVIRNVIQLQVFGMVAADATEFDIERAYLEGDANTGQIVIEVVPRG